MSDEPFHCERTRARKILGGVPARTFATLESEGVIVPFKRGDRGRASIYDVDAFVTRYIKHVTSRTVSDDRAARARREQSQAELNQLKLAQQLKELLPRDQVVREGQAVMRAVQAKLRALVRRMIQAGVITAEQEADVGALVHEALEEMSQWSALTDLEKAAADPG